MFSVTVNDFTRLPSKAKADVFGYSEWFDKIAFQCKGRCFRVQWMIWQDCLPRQRPMFSGTVNDFTRLPSKAKADVFGYSEWFDKIAFQGKGRCFRVQWMIWQDCLPVQRPMFSGTVNDLTRLPSKAKADDKWRRKPLVYRESNIFHLCIAHPPVSTLFLNIFLLLAVTQYFKFKFIVYLLFLLVTTTFINVRVRGDECEPMYCFMYCFHVFYMTTKQSSLLRNSIK